MLPLWHLAGFALGAATAAMGERAAMACTVAVEEAIDAHYSARSRRWMTVRPSCAVRSTKFRDEELQHRDIGLAHGAERPRVSAAVGGDQGGLPRGDRISERV